jgi:hypothetical protein
MKGGKQPFAAVGTKGCFVFAWYPELFKELLKYNLDVFGLI